MGKRERGNREKGNGERGIVKRKWERGKAKK